MATVKRIEAKFTPTVVSKRVAAYARVSSDKDAMLQSLSAQVSYYNNYITNHPGWELIEIYSDEGISGTKEDRPGFQKMLEDCRKGKRILANFHSTMLRDHIRRLLAQNSSI